MNDAILDRFLHVSRHGKVPPETLEGFVVTSRWAFASKYGPSILPLIHSIYPPKPSTTEMSTPSALDDATPNPNLTAAAPKVKEAGVRHCTACKEARHNKSNKKLCKKHPEYAGKTPTPRTLHVLPSPQKENRLPLMSPVAVSPFRAPIQPVANPSPLCLHSRTDPHRKFSHLRRSSDQHLSSQAPFGFPITPLSSSPLGVASSTLF